MNPPASNTTATREASRRLVEFFETLTPEALTQLPALYHPQARFKDPFNEVQGLPAIEAIFRHMYASLDAPHFEVRECLVDGAQAFLVWDFRFRLKRFDRTRWHTVRGGSHCCFAPDGRVIDHRDYWDAAEELYEKLPLLGPLMRWLRRRANQ